MRTKNGINKLGCLILLYWGFCWGFCAIVSLSFIGLLGYILVKLALKL